MHFLIRRVRISADNVVVDSGNKIMPFLASILILICVEAPESPEL